MAVAFGAATQLGLLSQQYPPPLLPKPGKDNAKLQKLLKRTAKRKASTQASQSATHFRSSLSPVNEASPDLEHSDHSTPPKTPEAPFSLSGVRQPPRFTIRPLYQHVASPYPQRAAYGRAARFSPQTVAMPLYSSQHVTAVSAYAGPGHLSGVSKELGTFTQQVVPKISPVSPAPVAASSSPEVKRRAVSPFSETHVGLRLTEATPQPEHTSPSPGPYPAKAGQALIRPITVLTPFVKPKSPRPTFRATEPSRSPKPMFDVPQIRMYTASTSYYETSRTPPVFDSAGLTAIGSTVTPTPTEAKQDLTPLLGSDLQMKAPTSETKISTAEMKAVTQSTPTPEIKRVTPTPEIKRVTPTPEIKRVTPTPEIKRVTPTLEIRRVTPTPEIKRVTPTPEIRRVTPTPEIRRVTPTPEIRRVTPTPEIKRVTPTPEIRRVTPTLEIKRVTPTPEIKRVTPTPEIKRVTPTPEIRRVTPTPEIKRVTPTLEIKRVTPTPEIRRVTPTPEIRRVTPTPEIKRVTPTPEIKRVTPTPEIRRVTPTLEIKRVTPTPEIRRVTPTPEIRRVTPTLEIRRVTPTPEIRAKTPTYDFQTVRSSAGRPKTPAYHITRAATPVFEISRPNPLLFAVSPITVQPERSTTPKTVSEVSSVFVSESAKTTETIPNGDVNSDMTPAAKPVQQSITKSESDVTRGTIQTPPNSQPTPEPTTPVVTSHGYQRPKTPTFEASRLMTTSPGYKRPKTPTHATTPSGVSHVASHKPKTPTQVSRKSKSSYRGLTPPEYAAYGGIKTYSSAFGFSSSKMQMEEDGVHKEPSQKVQPITEVSQVKGTPKDLNKHHQRDEKIATIQSVPTIIVSQASDTSVTTLTQKTCAGSNQLSAKEEKTPVQEVTKHPLSKDEDQDSLTVEPKASGQDKAENTETKAVSDQKEPVESSAPAKAKDGGSKSSSQAPAANSTGSKGEGIHKKSESALAAKSAKKEADESVPAAELLLKVVQKPKGMKSKVSGWSRLKKHMVVEQEEPKFPEIGSQKEASKEDHGGGAKADEKAGEKPDAQDENQTKGVPMATKMWDAVLFQMFSTKESIMHQIELNRSEEAKGSEKENRDEPREIPSFAHRLPVLLFSPKFDAKKLKEAASRPATKISTVFEMGLIGRKGKDEEPKDFNRKAKGFTAT